jgi:hypothetical protein
MTRIITYAGSCNAPRIVVDLTAKTPDLQHSPISSADKHPWYRAMPAANV